MNDIKRYSNCDNEKEIIEFNFRNDTQNYRNQCRDCIKLINKEYRTRIKMKSTYEGKSNMKL